MTHLGEQKVIEKKDDLIIQTIYMQFFLYNISRLDYVRNVSSITFVLGMYDISSVQNMSFSSPENEFFL